MTLQTEIREYLDASGLSKRALSLRAGLNPKAVSDILLRTGVRPDRRTLDSLGDVMGVHLETPPDQQTYASLTRKLAIATGNEKADRRNKLLISRLRKFLKAAELIPETTIVDRRRAIQLLSAWSPATLGLSARSFDTYKSDILAAIDRVGPMRPAGIQDVSGRYRELHDLLSQANYPVDLFSISGPFFHFLDDREISPADITTDTLNEYFLHRLAHSPKGEAQCRKHVRRIAKLCTRLASDPTFSRFGFKAIAHPFTDSRDRYGVEESVFSTLLKEFDGPVTQWLNGKISREGLSELGFLAQLDAADARHNENPKKALLKKKAVRGPTDDERRSAGFLLPSETWSATTVQNRRYQLIAGAKALFAATGYLIESVSEYTDPDIVDNVLELLSAGNSDDAFPSSYAGSVGKTLKKLARDYVGRGVSDVTKIAGSIADHTLNEAGISRRNKAKLRQLIGDRQQRIIDLSDILIDEVNTSLDRKRQAARSATRLELIGPEEARDIMCAIASDILLARAPRRANVTRIKLDWVSWAGATARIVIPNVEVKGRTTDDPDLPVPLDAHASARLKTFLEKVRPRVLQLGDEENPYLFPAQASTEKTGQPYVGLLDRLMRHSLRFTGVKMNPHLYRHFLGWLWLKEDPNRLPDVQRLLGHKSLETTLAYYAEIDEDLALDRWNEHLSNRKSRHAEVKRTSRSVR